MDAPKEDLETPSLKHIGPRMEMIMYILGFKEFCKEKNFFPWVFGLIAWQGGKSQHNSVELGHEKQQVRRIYEAHK